MNMLRCSLLCLALCLHILILAAQDGRPVGNRICSTNYQSEDSMFGQIYSTFATYHYASDQTALLDSISFHTEEGIPWDSLTVIDYTYRFFHYVTQENGYTRTEYFEIRNEETLPSRKYVVVKNSSGQVIQRGYYNLTPEGTSNNGYTWTLHYNGYNQPDSLNYELYGSANSLRDYYLLEYDDLHRLSQTVRYNYHNNSSDLTSRYVQHYAADVQAYANPLQVISYANSSVRSGLEWLLPICDTNYPPESIDYETWNGTGWEASITGYNVVHNNSYTAVYIYDNQPFGGSQPHTFLPSGMYVGGGSEGGGGEVSSTTTIVWEEYVPIEDNVIPETLNSLHLAAFPNPFQQHTNISFELLKAGILHLSVYNIKGQFVKTLTDSYFSKGKHELTWDGKDSNNRPVSSGVYLVRISNGTASHTAKLMKS